MSRPTQPTRTGRRPGARVSLLALALVILGTPGVADAQDPDVPAIPEERMEVYARTFRAVTQVRDEMYNRLARTHDREGKERLREEMNQKLAAVYEEQGMPVEEYQQITFVVSVDAAQRELFERLLAELQARPPSSGGT